jgi:hypothetical protein
MAHRKNVSKGKARSASRDALHHTLRLSALAGALGAGLGVDVPAAVAADPTVKPGAMIGLPTVSTPGQSQQIKIMPKPGQSPQLKFMPKPGLSRQFKIGESPGGSTQFKFFRPTPGTSQQEKLELPSTAGSTQQEDAAVQRKGPSAQMKKAGQFPQVKYEDLMSIDKAFEGKNLPKSAGPQGMAVPPPQSADPRNLQLRGYGTDATSSSGDSPGEPIPFNYGGIEYQYTPQDSSDDQGDPPRGYDLKKGKEGS